jgi:hypothetical protein
MRRGRSQYGNKRFAAETSNSAAIAIFANRSTRFLRRTIIPDIA